MQRLAFAALAAVLVAAAPAVLRGQDLDFSDIARDDIKQEAAKKDTESWLSLPSIGSTSKSTPPVAAGSSSWVPSWMNPWGASDAKPVAVTQPTRRTMGTGKVYNGSAMSDDRRIETTPTPWWDPLALFHEVEEKSVYGDVNSFLSQDKLEAP